MSSAPKARWAGGDFVRGRSELLSGRGSTLESVAEVLKVFLSDLQLRYFFDHRREVCQRADLSRRRRGGGPDHSPSRSQNERILNRFERHAALVKLGREHSVRAAGGAARARSRTVGSQKPAYIVALFHELSPVARAARDH